MSGSGVSSISGVHGDSDDVNNDLYQFDTAQMLWKRFSPDLASLPKARSDCTLVATDAELYMFGGTWTFSGKCPTGVFVPQREDSETPFLSAVELNDLWVFNLKTETWKELQYPGAPSQRTAHVSFVSGGFLFVHGGYDQLVDVRGWRSFFRACVCFDRGSHLVDGTGQTFSTISLRWNSRRQHQSGRKSAAAMFLAPFLLHGTTTELCCSMVLSGCLADGVCNRAALQVGFHYATYICRLPAFLMNDQ